MMIKDYTPTKETISLHGLGFIQIKLEGGFRLHVWHPELPRRDCFNFSPVHNHRFSFLSTILKGTQINVRQKVQIVGEGEGTHRLISHDGKRLATGSRKSYPVADCVLYECSPEIYGPGMSYSMAELEYHRTEANGVVITIMQKTSVGDVHANSVILKGYDFDIGFDRFQKTPKQLMDYVVDALES